MDSQINAEQMVVEILNNEVSACSIPHISGFLMNYTDNETANYILFENLIRTLHGALTVQFP